MKLISFSLSEVTLYMKGIWSKLLCVCACWKYVDNLKSAFTGMRENIYVVVSMLRYVDKVSIEFLSNFSRECQQNATNAKEWGINQWSMTLMTHRGFFKVTKCSRTRWQAASLPHGPLSLIKLFPQICWMIFFIIHTILKY